MQRGDAGHALGIALDAGAVASGQGVIFVEHLALGGVYPVDPSAVEALRLDLVEIAPRFGVDQKLCRTGPGGPDVALRYSLGAASRQADRVGGSDVRVMGADHQRDGTGAIPVQGELPAEDLGSRLPVVLLVPLVGKAVRGEIEGPDQLGIVGHGETGRLAPAQGAEPTRAVARAAENRRDAEGQREDHG